MAGVKGRSGGHNRVSIEEHKKRRNYRPSRHDHLAASPAALVPSGPVAKPSGLSTGAGAVWDALAPICVDLGTLTASDARAFGNLCELQATLTELVAAGGRSYDALRAMRLAAGSVRPWLQDFGLAGPQSRTRLPAKPSAPADNPLARFMKLPRGTRWPELK